MPWFKKLFEEMMTPSKNESDFIWALVAIGHAVVGAAGFLLIGWWALPIYLLKELHDLKIGGKKLDGAVDIGFFMLGLVYGTPEWPWLVLSGVALGVFLRNALKPKG